MSRVDPLDVASVERIASRGEQHDLIAFSRNEVPRFVKEDYRAALAAS
jgi:hypothetical protein